MSDTTIKATAKPGVPWDAIGFASGLILFVLNLWRHRLFVHDDTYISLRYARNLAEHAELTWNLGERIEGYTNFLHVVASAGLIRLGLDPLVAAQLLNVGAAVLLLASAAWAARLVAPQRPIARAAAIAMLGATPGVAVWVLGGLEAVTASALLGLGIVGVLLIVSGNRTRGAVLAIIAFSLAVLTRLDTAVFIAGAGLGLLLVPSLPGRSRLVLATLVVGVPAATAFAHMGWRYSYYGELLPLTFYAKTGVAIVPRLSFFPGYVATSLFPALIVTLGFLGLLGASFWRGAPDLVRVLGVPMLAYVAYVAWAGGDHMLGARLFLPVLVPAAMLVLLASLALSQARAQTAMLTALILVLAAGFQFRPLKQDDAAFFGRLVGKFIADQLPAGSTIALHTAGSTPYFASDNTFIDMLGLNDPHIARRNPVPMRAPWQAIPGHGKGDGDYVIARQPDYIILGPAGGIPVDAEPWFLTDVELAENAAFARCYDKQKINLDLQDAAKHKGRPTNWPILFTYYMRTCD